MTILDITLRGTKFSLNTNDKERTNLIAQQLESTIETISQAHSSGITDLKAFLLAAMILQDENLTLKEKNHTQDSIANADVKLAQTIDKVTEYITDLTMFIEHNSKQ